MIQNKGIGTLSRFVCLLLTALLVMSFMVGCSEKEKTVTAEDIVGQWISEDIMKTNVLVFNSDLTFYEDVDLGATFSNLGTTTAGTYSVAGGVLTLYTENGSIKSYKLRMQEQFLVLTSQNGNDYVFEKDD